MRNAIVIIIILFISAALADQLDKYYAIPKKNNVSVYENAVRKVFEQAKFTVSVDSRLTILEENKNMYKVQDDQNRVGWVEKHLVIKRKRSKLFIIEDAFIHDYIDNPTVIIIPDATDPKESQIKLDRSFIEQLKRNTDRETLQRATHR
ncbi:hypothetical protein ACFL5S_00310 [Fibrobacterota bacterium]